MEEEISPAEEEAIISEEESMPEGPPGPKQSPLDDMPPLEEPLPEGPPEESINDEPMMPEEPPMMDGPSGPPMAEEPMMEGPPSGPPMADEPMIEGPPMGGPPGAGGPPMNGPPGSLAQKGFAQIQNRNKIYRPRQRGLAQKGAVRLPYGPRGFA